MANFQTFKVTRPWPWPWIRSYGIWLCSTRRPLSTHQVSCELGKLFVDGHTYIWMYVRTDIETAALLGRLCRSRPINAVRHRYIFPNILILCFTSITSRPPTKSKHQWTTVASVQRADIPTTTTLWNKGFPHTRQRLVDLDASITVSSKDITSWSSTHSCWSFTLVNRVCRYTCAINWSDDADPDICSKHTACYCFWDILSLGLDWCLVSVSVAVSWHSYTHKQHLYISKTKLPQSQFSITIFQVNLG